MPPLALDDADDEALRCCNLTDAVFTPAVDIVFSAAAVGVLHRQVRAWWAELLGLLFLHLAVLRVVIKTYFLPSFQSDRFILIYQKWFLPPQIWIYHVCISYDA